MPNTSATGGYLVPDGVITPPLEDAALDAFLHDVIAGITGLDNTLVRPRWQFNPGNIPSRSTNWVAFGVMNRRSDTFAAEVHSDTAAAGEGADTIIRHEELDLLASFYGPNCQGYGALFRDGLSVAQNREVLFLAGMGLVAVEDLVNAPELVKEAWYNRADLPLTIRREVRREYPVLNLLLAHGTVYSEDATVPFNVNP